MPNLLQKAFAFLLIYFALAHITLSQKNVGNSVYNYSLKELSELKAVTGSFNEKKRQVSPSNITIVTKQMIEERGYQTLVDVCQDVPGFDFMVYNDGGGEYPGFSKNRGIGEVGNPEVLIMINGVIQNNISFNWSSMWTFENMLIDVEQIEIVQGPGSAMYGAQAFTGVINIITIDKYKGIKAVSSYGSYETWRNDLLYGGKLNNDLHLSVALHQYHSTGDMGLKRFDPAGYFSGNLYPDTILANYDNEGNFVTNVANPLAGQAIPNGFNTVNNSYGVRSKLSYKNTALSFFYANTKRGIGSYIVPYEYYLTDKTSVGQYSYMNIVLDNKTTISPKLMLSSQAVYRTTDILPATGFKYLYKFPEMSKQYSSYSYQAYLEERLSYFYNENSSFHLGAKFTYNRKSDRIISLGINNTSKTRTLSSWNIADAGDGINKPKNYDIYYEKEAAVYALWDRSWLKNLNTSIGVRYDYNSDFGNILNPRLSLMYNPVPAFGIKLLYGTAFRQAGIFELYNEFRGNENLAPERISTSEIEIRSLVASEKVLFKANIFHSSINNYIGKIADSTTPSGERYENYDQTNIIGGSAWLVLQINDQLRIHSNYSYTVGFDTDASSLYELDNTAKSKINGGINSRFFNGRLIADFRVNYVGKRKARETNVWMHTYENGYAPSYFKANLAITYKFYENFGIQLSANNLFNEQYYGVGRENGNGIISDYDPATNQNPDGHIPPYHPQLGSTFMMSFLYNLGQEE